MTPLARSKKLQEISLNDYEVVTPRMGGYHVWYHTESKDAAAKKSLFQLLRLLQEAIITQRTLNFPDEYGKISEGIFDVDLTQLEGLLEDINEQS
jgi:hypothetical protein